MPSKGATVNMLATGVVCFSLLACGIPSSQQYPGLPTVDPGQSKATGGQMSFVGDGDPTISYRLWYKIYPWQSDSDGADLIEEDVTYFNDDIVRDEDKIKGKNFRLVRLKEERNSNLTRILEGAGNVLIGTDYQNSITIQIGNGGKQELGRDIYQTTKRSYKSFFGEYQSGDSDVRSRWNDFGDDFGLVFLVQSVKLDAKLLKRLYSTPLVVGYFVMAGQFNNNKG